MQFIRTLILLFTIFISIEGAFNKIVWCFWKTGIERSNKITQLTYKNLVHYGSMNGWQVRLVDQSSMLKWVQDIPQFMFYYNKINNYKIFPWVGDYVRAYLLKHYGGIWMDINNIIYEDFEWVNKLDQQQFIVNKHGDQPQYFAFHQESYSSLQKAYTQQGEQVLVYPGLQNWMFASKQNGSFINDVMIQYKKAFDSDQNILDDKKHYLDEYQIDNKMQLRDICSHMVSMPCGHYLIVVQVSVIALHIKQKQLDQKTKGGKRKFAVHQYKCWTMQAKKGPLFLKEKTTNNYFYFLSYFIKMDIPSVQKQVGKKWRYFSKLIGPHANILSSYMQFMNLSFDRFVQDLLVFVWGYKSYYSYFYCANNMYILENSVLNKYLLSRDPQYQKTMLLTKYPNNIYCDPFSKKIVISFVLLTIVIIVTNYYILKLIRFLLNKFIYKNDQKILVQDQMEQLSQNLPK